MPIRIGMVSHSSYNMIFQESVLEGVLNFPLKEKISEIVDEVDLEFENYNIDAIEVRNELSMINDPRDFEKVLGYPPGYQHAPNVEAIDVNVYGIHHIFMRAKRDILAGEEIMVEYGNRYWERIGYIGSSIATIKELNIKCGEAGNTLAMAKKKITASANRIREQKQAVEELSNELKRQKNAHDNTKSDVRPTRAVMIYFSTTKHSN